MNQGYEHEFQRIRQFQNEAAGDDQKLRAKLLLRAGRCNPDKLIRFVDALREFGLKDIATYINELMIKR